MLIAMNDTQKQLQVVKREMLFDLPECSTLMHAINVNSLFQYNIEIIYTIVDSLCVVVLTFALSSILIY